jgi:hypothetical protein
MNLLRLLVRHPDFARKYAVKQVRNSHRLSTADGKSSHSQNEQVDLRV